MSSMFETHLVTIESNALKNAPGTRQPIAGYSPFGKHVVCHVGRASKRGSILTLHILKKYLDLLPSPLLRGFKVTDEATGYTYSIEDYPVWGGGKEHHIECTLTPYK